MPSIHDQQDLEAMADEMNVPSLQNSLSTFINSRLHGRKQGDLSNAELDELFAAADVHMQGTHNVSVWDAMLLINNANSAEAEDDLRRGKSGTRLYHELNRTLASLGLENAYGKGDYWIVDDDYGDTAQKICIFKLSFASRSVISAIQKCLRAFPDWRVLIQLEIPTAEGQSAEPGLTIYPDHIEQAWDKEKFAALAASLGI